MTGGAAIVLGKKTTGENSRDDTGLTQLSAQLDGRDVCAHVCSHNDRCEVCDDGHETNKRECFHAHGTWHGGMTPQMVSDVAGVPALAEAAATAPPERSSASLLQCVPKKCYIAIWFC